METVAFSLPEDLRARLEALANASQRPIEDCLVLAVTEFVEAWERHLEDIHQITGHEARAVLKAAND